MFLKQLLATLNDSMVTLTLFKPVLPFAVFPDDQNLRCVENGGVGTADKADEHDGNEVANRSAAKQQQCSERKHGCQLGIDGAW